MFIFKNIYVKFNILRKNVCIPIHFLMNQLINMIINSTALHKIKRANANYYFNYSKHSFSLYFSSKICLCHNFLDPFSTDIG